MRGMIRQNLRLARGQAGARTGWGWLRSDDERWLQVGGSGDLVLLRGPAGPRRML